VGTGRGISIGELAAMILKMFPTDKQILAESERLRPAKSEVMSLICNNTKAREVLGWQPQYTLEQGLERTLDYVERHLHQYKTTIFNR
jgi:nucleoside-diphosphate-sugar epimerase